MKLSQDRKEKVMALCQTLIRAQSYSGQENTVANELKKYMLANGFDDVHVDKYGSVIGRIQGNMPGTAILLDGHIDTVPVPNPDDWSFEPFGAQRIDGKIYGRGTSDMKGAVAAMTNAAIFFAEDTQRNFAGTLYVTGVVHEECFEGIAAREISAYAKPDLVVIGESSELNLKIGQRGRGEIIVETFGIPAHSANPHKGVNAVYLMCQLIEALREMVPPEDDTLGLGVAELTDIISSPYPGASVVPSRCRATYDRRLLVGETPDSVLKPFQDIIENLEKTIPNFKASVKYSYGTENCYTGNKIEGDRFFPGWCASNNDDFVQLALQGLHDVGIPAEISHYSFCTNGSHYAGEAKIKTIGFGPSREDLAHTINEYIEEEQLIKATEGYIGICRAFLK